MLINGDEDDGILSTLQGRVSDLGKLLTGSVAKRLRAPAQSPATPAFEIQPHSLGAPDNEIMTPPL